MLSAEINTSRQEQDGESISSTSKPNGKRATGKEAAGKPDVIRLDLDFPME
jgi:hypothetical protein